MSDDKLPSFQHLRKWAWRMWHRSPTSRRCFFLVIPAVLIAVFCLAADSPWQAHGAGSSSANAGGNVVTSNEASQTPLPQASQTKGSSDQRIIAYINEHIRQGWKDFELEPSRPATDGEWIRRVYLDLIGRIPTAEETKKFTADKASDKREQLVDALLYSDEYIEEYARNWTNIWTNILIGRTGGTQQGTLVDREGLQQYLRSSFLYNKPYDDMVVELVSARGVNKPGEENYNGAVNFLLDNVEENATPATAKVSKIFLGTQVQCTQCHNHPFNDWNQASFWEMNAFFRQMRPLRTRDGRDIVSVELTDEDFPGENNDPSEAAIYYELRNGLLKIAFPKFIDGTTIDPQGYVDRVNRRQELARMISTTPQLSQTIANRMWGHFFGYGFTKPVDDMGPHNRPSHPELLDRLAQDFADYGYNLKQLMKWYVLSEPYSLSSSMVNGNKADDPTLGVKPMFSHFYMRQMSAEQLYESLIVATEADKSLGSYEQREQQKTRWLQQFSVAFGTDENDEATTFNGSIPQTLMMWNGDLIAQAIGNNSGSLLSQLAANSRMSDQQKIEHLYWTSLSRRPTRNELGLAQQLWQIHSGDSVTAMQDIYWAMLNTNEFILQH
ncbi:MAG: DUF1549 and DUF1553 domain-containing protein [Pirellulales bacterium]|nr:DUF1549 and DUF1553 domain-containing protein [Pirellulales bacterium]